MANRVGLLGQCLRILFMFALAKGADGRHVVRRLRLGLRALRAYLGLRRQTASTFPEQMLLLDSILKLDPGRDGDIAEFGCFKGAASVILSLWRRGDGPAADRGSTHSRACPSPTKPTRTVANKTVIDYRKGMFAGRLDEVRGNIERLGEPESVQYVKGFFSETLPTRPAEERYAFIFEDADLVSSVRDVLRWPGRG